MTYEEWEMQVPEVITSRFIWKMKAYRLAMFVSDLGWHDVTKLSQDSRTVGVANQLYRSLGSIGANMAEGFSRSSGKDRARIHEIALGEAEESREWYWRGRHIIGEKVVEHRLEILNEISRLLSTTISVERTKSFREEAETYDVTVTNSQLPIANSQLPITNSQ